MQTNVIYNKDCVEGMLALPKGSVDIIVTSPPYNLNIQYGAYKDDLPRDSYLKWMRDVFVAVNHCLKDNGHFFLNVGYSNIDPWVGMDVGNVARELFVLQNNFTWVKSIHVDDKTISKVHCKLEILNAVSISRPGLGRHVLTITDHSTFGTFVNGEKLGKGTERKIHPQMYYLLQMKIFQSQSQEIWVILQ